MSPAEQDLIAEALSRGGKLGPSLADALEMHCGGDDPSTPPPAPEKREQEMVEADFFASTDGVTGRIVATIPCITRSEANESAWHRKMMRKLSAKKTVREALRPEHWALTQFAEAYHVGKALRVTLTRLGGRRLDKTNLPTSMKAIEDVLAGALLADDGDPRWHVSYEQEPGGPVGVRVTMEILA